MVRKFVAVLLAVMLCAGAAAAAADGEIAFQEVKLISQLFNGAVVGKVVIPVGWNVVVKEYMLNDGMSITTPNVLCAYAYSPDGSVTMAFVSRMDYRQEYLYGMGVESQSKDSSFDQSTMMYMLNYRNASGACDYMLTQHYPETTHVVLSERTLSDSENQALYRFWQEYDSGIRKAYNSIQTNAELKGTDATIAERTYQSGSNKTVVNAVVVANEILTPYYQIYKDTINWSILCSYAMQAPEEIFDQCMDIFSIFTLNSTTTQEYVAMTNQHSRYLKDYFDRLRAGLNPDPNELSTNLDKSVQENVGSGNTYSAMDGWTDVIRNENDYTLSNGSHVKVSTDFDHVYEDSDGNIYAGYGSFYPQGTTELFPTPVGGR